MALAEKLIALKPDTVVIKPEHRFGTGYGKPNFPEELTLSTALSDLAGIDSWWTLQILQVDMHFLTEDVHRTGLIVLHTRRH